MIAKNDRQENALFRVYSSTSRLDTGKKGVNWYKQGFSKVNKPIEGTKWAQ